MDTEWIEAVERRLATLEEARAPAVDLPPLFCASKWDCACTSMVHSPGCARYSPPCAACGCFGCYGDCAASAPTLLAENVELRALVEESIRFGGSQTYWAEARAWLDKHPTGGTR